MTVTNPTDIVVDSPLPTTKGTNGMDTTESTGNGTAVTASDTKPSENSTIATEAPKPSDLSSEITEKILTNFTNSLAVLVDARLKSQVEIAKEEIEKQNKAKEEEAKKKAAEEEKKTEEKKVEKTPVGDMLDEVCKIDSIYNEDGEREFSPFSAKRGQEDDGEGDTDEYGKWVLVLRRVFNYDVKLMRTKMDVKSPIIKKIIKDVCNEGAMETEKASIPWPNDKIFRYRDQIRDAAEKEGDLAVKHCKVLLDLIEKDFGSKVRDCKEMFPKGVSSFEILREMLWPKDYVFSVSRDGHPRMYQVSADPYYTADEDGKYLGIPVNYIDYDGERFGLASQHLQVREFAGVKYVKDLTVIPVKHLEKRYLTEAFLLERGKRFASLAGQHYKSYEGVATAFNNCRTPVSVNSRVMIDTKTFNRLRTYATVSVRRFSGDASRTELTNEEFMMCTHEVPLFSFTDKEFYRGTIETFTDIVWNADAFKNLVLPDEQKELVRILVENHVTKQESFDDFIKGKGKGLISVLHGPPGVGKTMTAESVAEHTKRPLYMVTSGELGSKPAELEEELTKVLDLAKTWNAILLLDEADVFMEQRTSSDLVRNSLVSIFLRQLEYYQGILFLTTNRVGTFDEAFHSRIHISLHYHNLTPEAREYVWRNFATSLGTENVDLSNEDYKFLAQTELNGRQIKNMFRTARALSNDKKEKIMIKHLRVVMGVMATFDLQRTMAESSSSGMEQK